MKERASGTASAIDYFFGEDLKIFRVVVGFVAHDVDQPAPAVPETDDLIAFAECSEGDPADRGIQSRNVASTGDDADDAFALVDVSHVRALVMAPFWVELNK